jgi:hypothetical protein
MLAEPVLLRKHLEKTLADLKADLEASESRLRPFEQEITRVREDMTILDTRLEMRRLDVDTYKLRIGKLQSRLKDLEQSSLIIDPSFASDVEAKREMIEGYAAMVGMTEGNDSAAKWLLRVTDQHLRKYDKPDATYTPGALGIHKFMLALKDYRTREGLIGIVYPDRIELRQDFNALNISPSCRSARCP